MIYEWSGQWLLHVMRCVVITTKNFFLFCSLILHFIFYIMDLISNIYTFIYSIFGGILWYKYYIMRSTIPKLVLCIDFHELTYFTPRPYLSSHMTFYPCRNLHINEASIHFFCISFIFSLVLTWLVFSYYHVYTQLSRTTDD